VRLSLRFGVVQSGGEPIREPLHWPVFFAVDDPALRFLAGDVASSDWLHAPGPLSGDDAPAWIREVAVDGVAGAGYLGFGLMYSDGGATDEATQAVHDELVATLHTLALDHVAHASGLGVMLGAFGSTTFEDRRGEPPLDRLRDGLDPEKLSGEIDQGVKNGIGAFRAVRDSLLPFTPGVPVTSLSTGGNLTTTLAAARQPRPRIVAAEAGRVVAVTVQAWRVEEIAAKGAIEIRRELPVRGGRKVQLTLQGRAGREGQR
jgi:hypothetical protein